MKVQLLLVTLAITTTAVTADDCGKNPSSRQLVVGGSRTNPGEWPWIAALFYQNVSVLQYKCGAVLFSTRHVVTVAHCVRHIGRTLPANLLVVKMGRDEIYDWRASPIVQIRHGTEVLVHPSYLESKITGVDLAVIKFSQPIRVTDYVSPICIWRSSFDNRLSRSGKVVGWGFDETGFPTEEPRLTTMPIVSRQVCLDSHEEFYKLVNENGFCAGNRDGTGPCHGDSGSGMYVLVLLPNGKNRWALRGLVSTSIFNLVTEKCDLNHYTVFTDMAKMANWLPNEQGSDLPMVQLRGRSYYFSEDKLSWYDAQRFCRSHGLELASLETEEENRVVVEHKKKVHNSSTWIGGTNEDSEGRWWWSGTGQAVSYTNWFIGSPQPSIIGTMFLCMSICQNDVSFGAWCDYPGSNNFFYYICEAK